MSIYLILISLVYSGFMSCKSPRTTTPEAPDQIAVTVTNTIKDASFDTAYLMGRFDPATHPDFTMIPPKYRDEEVRYLRKDVLASFIAMHEAAARDGINLRIRSATRNFDNQKRIWENKWTGKTILEDQTNAARDIPDPADRARKILEYSSMPGTSRHHWGTDIDLNAFTNEFFENGEGLKIYTWLFAHAREYGFCQPYTQKGTDRITGYYEEKWHWSWMPVSERLTELARTELKNEMIGGFLGYEAATRIDVVKNYVLGISPSCLHKK